MARLILPLLIALIQLTVSNAWSYNDQDSWIDKYCQKSVAQSPIDIETKDTIPMYTEPLKGSNWHRQFNATITNNGHTVLVEPILDKPITLLGGGLPGKYVLSSFHFHWDSEHTIDRHRKALEAHFVFYNNKFVNQSEAVNYANGIAVLAVLYEISPRDNPLLRPIVNELEKIQSINHSSRISIKLLELLPRNRRNFYRYWGSLTTPDCNDVVVWTIFTDLSFVSQEQVDQFASIKDSKGMKLTKNFRKIQPLHCRNVFNVHGPHF